MKWLIVVINLIVLVNSIAAVARQEKIIKKPLGLKPKTILDEFRNLSPADEQFIKEVDKQFKVHGDKIKIKVERENSTVVNKNTKRTIDGSLGYGYHQNQNQQGYYFSQPHVMHKFTMHDLPNEKNGYREQATEIEVQQSHSYEITEQANYQPSGSPSYQHEQVYEDPVPVIVLRVPGPQKYAVHLQALLQQYLEIRAAQYIKVLEEQERHGQLHHPQHYVTQQHQHMQYMSMYSTPMYHQSYYQNQPQPHPGFQQYFQVNHGNNYAIPAGEQSYYSHSQPQPQEYHNPSTQPQQEYHHQPTQPQQEYHHQPTQPQQEYHNPSTQPQQEYPSSYINFVTPTYEQEDLSHQNHQQQVQEHDVQLETSENYPSEKHTQVVFKKKKTRVHRPSITYQQQPEPIVPIVVPDQPQHHEESYQHHPEHHQQVQQLYTYTNNFNEHAEEPEVVAVTQRSQSPVNYHVLKSTLGPTQEELHERHNPKRMAAPFSKEQFEKAQRMMTKSKRNRGSMRQEKQMEKSSGAPKS